MIIKILHNIWNKIAVFFDKNGNEMILLEQFRKCSICHVVQYSSSEIQVIMCIGRPRECNLTTVVRDHFRIGKFMYNCDAMHICANNIFIIRNLIHFG